MECYKFKLIDPSEVFVDATYVKARANNKRMQKRIAHEETLFFEDLLKKEINLENGDGSARGGGVQKCICLCNTDHL